MSSSGGKRSELGKAMATTMPVRGFSNLEACRLNSKAASPETEIGQGRAGAEDVAFQHRLRHWHVGGHLHARRAAGARTKDGPWEPGTRGTKGAESRGTTPPDSA